MIEGKQKLIWRCPYYVKWKDMLRRCYSKDTYRTYFNKCVVTEDWLRFSTFKTWLASQGFEDEIIREYNLDKDILGDGTIYSPQTCILVPSVINTFILDKASQDSECLRGVYLRRGRYIARCNNPLKSKREFLGSFPDEIEAHRTWCDRKVQLAKELCDKYSLDKVVEEKIVERFKYDA